MPSYSYSFQKFNKTKHVRASIRETDISHKHAREIALAIKGLTVEKARSYLEEVIDRKIAVPFRRYNNEVAHRSNIKDGFFSGRFPKRLYRLKLLDNLSQTQSIKVWTSTD
jgi:large subunit ribosomal protein L22